MQVSEFFMQSSDNFQTKGETVVMSTHKSWVGDTYLRFFQFRMALCSK